MLVGIPAWLVASTLFCWWAWKRQLERGEEGAKFAREIDPVLLAADLRKVADFASPRGVGDGEGRAGLTRMAAMIEGSLGPSNAGYQVRRLQGVTSGEGEWPALQVILRGDDRPPLWVVCPYDELPGNPDASGVVSTLAVASSLAGKSLGRPVHFLFIPHRNDPDLLRRMAAWIDARDLSLWVDATRGTAIELASGPREDPGFRLRVAPEHRAEDIPEMIEFGLIPVGTPENNDLTPATREMAGIIRELAR